MILFLVSVLAGVLTVLAPCVLPMLPIIVGGSVAGEPNKRRAFTVAISLGVSIFVFTILLKASSVFIHIPQYFWSLVSGLIILFYGVVTLSPKLWEGLGFVSAINRESNKVLYEGYKKKSLWGDIMIGAALGPVFSSCSPTYFLVLATVLPQNYALGVADLLGYTVGLVFALLIVSFVGQKLLARFDEASNPHSTFKKVLGIIFIFLGIAIILGFDKKVERYVIDNNVFDVTKIEQAILLKTSPKNTKVKTGANNESTDLGIPDIVPSVVTQIPDMKTELDMAKRLMIKSKQFNRSPEIVAPSGYINTDGKPITIGEFKGKKVVLVDFWTYSCINCQRTLPYLEAWYNKYKDKGLEIISIHTPEFAFEKVPANVEKASKDLGVNYPIVLDNDYATWSAFGNRFWPRKYLVDIDGFIIYDHIGEGDYDVTEKAIQDALKERRDILDANTSIPSDISLPTNAVSVEQGMPISRETYFGSARNEFLANGKRGANGEQSFVIPDTLQTGGLYLGGIWNITNEYAESIKNSSIEYKYQAKNVYFVGSASSPTNISIYRDGVIVKTVSVGDNKLYQLISEDDYKVHTLKILFSAPGVRAYTFTFG